MGGTGMPRANSPHPESGTLSWCHLTAEIRKSDLNPTKTGGSNKQLREFKTFPTPTDITPSGESEASVPDHRCPLRQPGVSNCTTAAFRRQHR